MRKGLGRQEKSGGRTGRHRHAENSAFPVFVFAALAASQRFKSNSPAEAVFNPHALFGWQFQNLVRNFHEHRLRRLGS